ncbi:serine hydrolase [Streptomyces sp. NPDC085540]|uniref:serine hydrolase n=1 Tax=Streptomyces sp. NPDC085540 TaxID=3365730 RepID=UPI0037CCEB7E
MKAVTVAGGSSDDPEIEAVTTALEGDPEAGTGTDVEAGAEPGSEASPLADADADAELPGDAGPETDSAPQNAAESEDEADAEADVEPEGETAPGAESKAQAGSELPHDAESKGAADAGLPGEAEPEDGTDPARSAAEADAAEPKADAEADTESPAKPKADAEPEGGSELPDDARPQTDAEPEAETEAETTAESEAEAVVTEPKADAEADVEPEGETAPGAESKAQAGSELPHDAESKGAADAGLPGEAEPEDGTDPARSAAEADAAEPKADAEADTESPAKPKADAEPEGGSELPDDARPQTDAEPEAETEAETTAESEGEGDPQGAVEAERAGADAVRLPSAARSETDAEAEAEAEAGVTARSAADADADDRLGDGEASAGDRADTGPEPEAEDDVVEATSDETMLITLPKQKPVEPDAPRKAPSWAREVEPDPERTSQFVALKDVDLPAPVAPPSQPQSPEAKAAGQAPAAPLPPLDLLAELTNTRPPVDTPRRTVVRRVKIWTPILLLLVGAGAGAQLLRPLPAPQLVSGETDRTIEGQFSMPWPAKGQAAVRVSGSGDIGTFGEQKPVPTASVAKVMTAYVILKGHPLRKADPGPDITVDERTVAEGNAGNESRIKSLSAGQKFSQQDMLKMLMIPSGNNVARLLARWDTGSDSEAAFVAKMNAAAKELGMDNTTYTDPSGLDAGTVSTAVDQLKLAEAVMKDEVFRSIVALPNATIKGLPTPLDNNNDLLNSSIRGIKTGSSTPAGGALMWAAYKSVDDKNQLILGTLMDQHADGPDEDGANSLKLVLANSKTVIEAVRNALASAPVVRKGDVVGHVDDGLGGRTPLVATKDLNVIGVPGQKLKLSLTRTSGAGPLPHTAKAGSEVAVLTLGSGEGAPSVPVAVKGALAEPSFGTRLTRGR